MTMTLSEINLSSPAFIADPYPTYHQLRESAEPYWIGSNATGRGIWMFSRYDNVSAILRDGRISKDISRLIPPEQLDALDSSMLLKDPPVHTRLRGLTNQTFTPARIRDLEIDIDRIVMELIARIESQQGGDFISDFALPLPVTVIAEMLGVPHEDRDRFHTWSNQVISAVDIIKTTEEDLQNQRTAMLALTGYFKELIEQRRAEPQQDIISGLIAAHDAGDRLTEEEMLGTCILLLIAGHETTVNLLGNGLYTLLSHPDQLALVRSRSELIPSAIEEMLRYESPVQRGTFRITTEVVEFNGITLQAGQQVSAALGAANRDPHQFPDPDRFDVTRTPNRHLGFGLGIHFCLGAALARTEARIGFTRLLERLPNLHLVDPTPQWHSSSLLRGLKTLPVAC
jgi:cytochrome P450